MKRIIPAIVLTLLSAIVSAQINNFQMLVGKWEAVDNNNQNGSLEVIDSTNIFLVYGNQKMPVINYKADFTKVPAWSDFTVKDSTQELSLKSLIQFLNNDLIQWQVFDGDTRPAIFAADRGEMVYLKRKR
jgi:hypothetical protein